MDRTRAYRYELKPNTKQRSLFARHAGVARFAYNWGLAQRQELWKKGEKTNAIKQHRDLNKLKKSDFPWMYEVSKCAPQEALRDLHCAFVIFFEGRAKYPSFKKKGRKESFRYSFGIKPKGKQVHLPRIGLLRVKEKISFDGRILSGTVSRTGNRWFLSLTVVETVNPAKQPEGAPIGVDLGITQLAVLSNGIAIENRKPLKRLLRKLRKLNKELSRRKKGSRNWLKTVEKLRVLYYRISCIRSDTLHQLTSYLSKNHTLIMIEDLHVKGMLKNRRLSRAISDVGFFEFRRQLEYKCSWYGSRLVVVDRFFPSSKLCSRCGFYHSTLTLLDRVFVCPNCGLVLDRDLNAALNLEACSWRDSLHACGEEVRLACKHSSVNQELSLEAIID